MSLTRIESWPLAILTTLYRHVNSQKKDGQERGNPARLVAFKFASRIEVVGRACPPQLGRLSESPGIEGCPASSQPARPIQSLGLCLWSELP